MSSINKLHRLLTLLVVGGLVAAYAPSAHAADPASGKRGGDVTTSATLGENLVINGDFETPPGGASYSSGQSFEGWTVDYGDVELVPASFWPGVLGQQSIDLDGSNMGGISQTLATAPGQDYTLRFSMAGNPDFVCGTTTIKTMQVWWAGNLVDTVTFDVTGHTRTDMGWVDHEYSVTATDTSTELKFYSLTFGCHGPVIDNVSVEPSINAIDYHMRDDFHVFKIDLQSSHLSFETVMARDVPSVNYGTPSSSPREFVREMIAREPYSSRNPVLAFNADYFGNNKDGTRNHGPEGLTVKNGSRFDGHYAVPKDTDGNEWRRSSLSISSSNSVRMGKLDACQKKECNSWMPTDAYYNTVGGGPLFVDQGVRIGGLKSTKPCQDEMLAKSYCNTSFKWTAVGVTQDDRYLIVVSSELSKSMDDAAAVLLAEGAWKAIKLDGGGSTQVWYRFASHQSIIDGERPVADALIVFSSP